MFAHGAVAAAHQAAAVLPPHLASLWVIAIGAIVTLGWGLIARRGQFVRWIPATLSVVTAAGAFAPTRASVPSPAVLIALSAVLLAVHCLAHRRDTADPQIESATRSRFAPLLLAFALAATASLLLYNLGTYAGSLLNWETTTKGFAESYLAGQGVLRYTADRLFWDEGVFSDGQTSLFYGAPTYALFHLAGFSAWTLRLASVVAALLSVVLVYALGRRFFGPLVGAAAALFLGLSNCFLFYGRYGSSPAGTLLAVLLAVLCTWSFLRAERPAWWLAPACAGSLFAATLQYSPGRLVVLLLLACIAVVVGLQWRRLSWQRAVGVAVIALSAAGVWYAQQSYGTQRSFLSARGEQYFYCVADPRCVERTLARALPPQGPSLPDKLEVLYAFLRSTAPQYASLMRPAVQTEPLNDNQFAGVLPQLYYAPLAIFIAWGCLHSARRWRSWPHACLLLWLGGVSGVLLMANRVDAHRTMLLVVPLSLWGGLGIWEAARVMRAAALPLWLRSGFGLLLAVTVFWSDVVLLHRVEPPRALLAERLAAGVNQLRAVSDTRGDVVVGALWGFQEIWALQLALLDQMWRDPTNGRGSILPGDLLHAIKDEAGGGSETQIAALHNIVGNAMLILTPSESFQTLATRLKHRGMIVEEREADGLRFLLVQRAGPAAREAD